MQFYLSELWSNFCRCVTSTYIYDSFFYLQEAIDRYSSNPPITVTRKKKQNESRAVKK